MDTPATILVVDDEHDLPGLVKQIFRRRIKTGELRFHFAGDGEEALSLLRGDTEIDLILCDINMSRMDGLTLLASLKKVDRQLRTVVVSAYGDLQNIRTAMNRGAFDFVTKPIVFEDLQTTIAKGLEDLSVLRSARPRLCVGDRRICGGAQNREGERGNSMGGYTHWSAFRPRFGRQFWR